MADAFPLDLKPFMVLLLAACLAVDIMDRKKG